MFFAMPAATAAFAVLLAGAALTPRLAKADPLYDLSLIAERGSVSDNGTSLGAYAESQTLYTFQNIENYGNYPSDIFVSPALIDPTSVSSTTLNYTSGTGDLASQPITAAISLPDQNNLATPYFYTITGSVSLAGTFTNSGTQSRFSFTLEFMDPENDALLDELTVVGVVTAGGAGNGVDSWSYVYAFMSGVNEGNSNEFIVIPTPLKTDTRPLTRAD